MRRSLTLCAALGAVTWAVEATSIGVNFEGRNGGATTLAPAELAGVVPQAHWRNLPPNARAGFDGAATFLTDSTGALTRVAFEWESNAAWHSQGDTSDPSDANERLMKGIQKANPSPDTDEESSYMFFRWRNLLPGSRYNIIVYQMHNMLGAKASTRLGNTTYYVDQGVSFDGTWTRGTSIDPISYSPANFVQFDNVVPDVDGTIQFTVKKLIEIPQVGDGIGVPAVQLVKIDGDWPSGAVAPVIVRQPADILAVVGDTVTLSLDFESPPGASVQWFWNGTEMAGATGTELAIDTTALDKDAGVHAVVSNDYGSSTSRTALVTLDDPQPAALVRGFLRGEHYANITGTDITNTTFDEFALGEYDYEFFVAGATISDSRDGSFARLLEGWVVPPQSGDYRFFLRSDDASQLFVNPIGGTAGSLPLIPGDFHLNVPDASEPTCCQPFQEPPATQTSLPFSLTAGRFYGIAAIHKEGGGDDFFQLAWREEADPTSAAQLPSIRPRDVWCLASSAGKRAVIARQPQAVAVDPGKHATFSIEVETRPRPGEHSIQWTRNGTEIPGATSPIYTSGRVGPGDDGAVFRASVLTLLGELTSQPAVLSVGPDSTPPVALSAGLFEEGTSVGIRFSEALEPGSSSNPAQYQVDGAIVLSAELASPADHVVILSLDRVPILGARVRFTGLQDYAANPASGQVTVSRSVLTPATLVNNGSDPLNPGRGVYLGQGAYLLEGGGSDIWNTRDAGHMITIEWTGAFDVRARLESLDGPEIWTKAGIMVRESPDGGSRHIFLSTSRNEGANLHLLQWRDVANTAADAVPLSLAAGPVPYPNAWIRLVRPDATSNSFMTYLSTNGVDWTPYFEHTVPGDLLPETLHVGMATTAHDNSPGASPASAEFGLFSIGPVSPAAEGVVTTNLDVEDEADGLLSLREAVRHYNAITFDPALAGQTIELASPLVIIHRGVTIDATNLSSGLTLSGGQDSPLLHVVDVSETSIKGVNFLDGKSVHSGGAIVNEGGLMLHRCTIARSLSFLDGGGIYNTGQLELVNSTLSDNLAAGAGGAIFSTESAAVLVRHCTIVGNESFFLGGGGIASMGGILSLENSIVAANDAPVGRDLFGGVTALSGRSFIGDPTDATGIGEPGAQILTGNPHLSPLADHGPPTLTRLPLPGSPVIDGALTLPTTPPVDQLGHPRPSGPLPDLGSVEAVPLGLALAGAPDSELDGIPDLLEGPDGPYPHLDPGIDDSTVDTDGDGVTDGRELADMTNPLDGNDLFRILDIQPEPAFDPDVNPLVTVTLSTFPGLHYRLESGSHPDEFLSVPDSLFTADDYSAAFPLSLPVERGFVRAVRVEYAP